jgi:nitrous oxidase accessory protein
MGTIGVLWLTQQVLVVSPAGPFRHLGDAVRVATPGAAIVVRPGVYREPTVHVDRPVSIRGEPGAVLDGEGGRELLVIRAPDVTIEGLTFRHTGSSYREDRAAVRAVEASRCRIAGNRFEATFFAIYLQGADNCTVTANWISGEPGREAATGNGIHVWGSQGAVIRDNQVRGHRDGIYLEFARHASVRDNVSRQNVRYGLHFMFSDSSAYADNTFSANGTGVAVMYSKHVLMHRNAFRDSRGPSAYGLLLKDVTDVDLTNNRFTGNTAALVADGANRLEARGNAFEDNAWAVRLLASTASAIFTANGFERNTFDVTVNSRSVTATFAGNWWAAYRGWDLDRDGTGDVPHHPVRLFALLADRTEPALLLQRSLFVRLLDMAERAVPVLTPRDVADRTPRMRPSAGQVLP